jgi:sugar phosphate isomerase/epimerase
MPGDNRSRREFLKYMGVGSIALGLSDMKALVRGSGRPKIGMQLYTVRKEIEEDFEGTMKKVAETGFLGVEYYPLPEAITAERAAKVFKNLGLKVFGMHLPLPVGDARETDVRLAEMFECDRVIYPGWPEGDKYKNLEATKQTAETYSQAAAYLKSKGLQLGLHNHWWEFQKKSGFYPFYYLLEHLGKDIFFEIDTYWAKTGGQNPAEVIVDFGRRAPFLHIKDGPAVQGDAMYKQVPVGQGTLDFPSIVKAGGKNIEWLIVEFDEYEKDIFDGIKESYDFLVRNKLGEGKV